MASSRILRTRRRAALISFELALNNIAKNKNLISHESKNKKKKIDRGGNRVSSRKKSSVEKKGEKKCREKKNRKKWIHILFVWKIIKAHK